MESLSLDVRTFMQYHNSVLKKFCARKAKLDGRASTGSI